MADYTVKKCPKCGQQLRFPDNIGGMLMACPSCGNKFKSDFKLGVGGSRSSVPRNIFIDVFEMPYNVIRRIRRYFASK